MKKLILSFGCLMAFVFIMAQTPKLDWAKRMGGAYADLGNSIAIDGAGNVYTVGSFSDSADMDPGTARYMLKSAGETDMFISKLDASGKLVWAKRIGGAGSDAAYAIAIDASGMIYVTGGFTGTVDFDPAGTTFNLSSGSTSLTDIFIEKFSSSGGDMIWAKGIGSASANDYGSAIAVDGTYIYTTGFFYGTVDFDPNADVINLSSKGSSDIFISKLDVNGKFMWAKSIGSSAGDAARSIALDANSNVYTTGSFSGSADFDPGLTEFLLTSNGLTDIFVSKLDKTGNFMYAVNMGGIADEEGTAITVNGSGTAYITGRFTGTADFDPGTDVSNLTSLGDRDIYIVKLNAMGVFLWVNQMGGLLAEMGQAIALDAAGNVYTTGSFRGTVDFDPSATKYELTSLGNEDIFISKLASDGTFIWAKKIGYELSDVAQSIIISKTTGAIYFTGYFNGTVDFDPDAPKLELISDGLTDIFVEKINATSGAVESITISKIKIYPNPTNGIINLELGNKEDCKIEIINSIGQVVMEEKNASQFNIQHLPAGLYFIKVSGNNQLIASQKIAKE